MTLAKQTALFERIAFEAQLREHPGDRNAALAFVDWLTDNGYTVIGAKRVVTNNIRIETEKRQLTKLWDWMNESVSNSQRARWIVLSRCRTVFETQPEINFRYGANPPIWIRMCGHYRNQEGHEWAGPEGYPPLNTPVFWAPLREEVNVGAGWVLVRLFPPSKQPRE